MVRRAGPRGSGIGSAAAMALPGLLLLATLALLLQGPHIRHRAPSARAAPSAAQVWGVDRLATRCLALPWCTSSFWAWELRLAGMRSQHRTAGAIADRLVTSQQRNGSWGLGTAWGRTDYDFEPRTAHDAESWEVAEVGLALRAYAAGEHDHAAKAAARRAAGWLRRHVVSYRGGRYLSHMPTCNLRLQPHSTLAAAALLAEFPRYRALARELHASGKAMGWRRIMPARGQASLRHARWADPVNDYERIQIGWYLHMLGDPAGARILRHYSLSRPADSPLAKPYEVMVLTLLGKSERADELRRTTRIRPVTGYAVALADWLAAT